MPGSALSFALFAALDRRLVGIARLGRHGEVRVASATDREEVLAAVDVTPLMP